MFFLAAAAKVTAAEIKANTPTSILDSFGHKSNTGTYGGYYPPVALVTMQILLNVIMAFTSGNRVIGSVWFGPTSNLFHKEEDEKTKSKVYKNANMNESGHGLKAPASIAASSTVTVTGYNNNPAYQGYPPSPSTPQGTYSRRNHAQVDEYVDMANTTQYEKAQYSHQQATPAYPTSPISPYN
ncbi:6278_t:CDS:2 [Acaulospora colombiana]|uniref:6278_t:CDS:1 n=1 Tax=Acaulospora colombiana TaxID=27376 RepID=A0ACA9L2N7_9GLOM|nr:6278_t:CDS:2 [Acaulospora colombiana]